MYKMIALMDMASRRRCEQRARRNFAPREGELEVISWCGSLLHNPFGKTESKSNPALTCS